MSGDVTWHPTAFRSHTLAQIQENGENLLNQQVTVCGFAEAIRGKGKICFVILRDGTGHLQAFLKQDNLDEDEFSSVQNAGRESTIQVNLACTSY